jgi:hypothetical protein
MSQRKDWVAWGMSEYYGPADWDTSIETIHRALDLGITFLAP